MQQYQWQVDEKNSVSLHLSSFGKCIVKHNGQEIQRWKGNNGPTFALTDGSEAQVHVKRPFVGPADVELRVTGQLVRPMVQGEVPCCPSCKARIGGLDRFCDGCGTELPTAEQKVGQRKVTEASGAITALAVLFALSGVFMFFVQRSTSSDALAQLAGLPADQILTVEGQSYAVADLRKQVEKEPWIVLIVNLMLAGTMVVLSAWGKKSPLPAMIAAAAIYAVVIVGNAIVDPKTIAQGIFIKIIVIGFLFKGIKAALELKTAKA